MEGERLSSSEKEQKPLFDAVHVHGFWLSQKGELGRVKPSLRSRLEALAAALFYDGGRGVKHIVLTAGHIWGPNYPSLGELMAKELIKKYKIPRERIILKDEAVTTNQEIDTFLELAREHGWTRLADIAPRTQQWTIPIFYKQKGEEVELKAVENILTRKGSERVKRLVQKLGSSKYEWGYRFYQGAVRAILIVDPDLKFLGKIAREYRSKKGEASPPGIFSKLPIDKYNL